MFDNKDNALWPNQFVNIRLAAGIRKDSTVIPAACNPAGPQGTYVFVVKPDNTADSRPVTVPSPKTIWRISPADFAPEVVVTDGQDKLQAGSKVDTAATRTRQPRPSPTVGNCNSGTPRHEPVTNFYSSAGGHHFAHGGPHAGGIGGLSATAGFGSAGSRLPHHSGRDFLSGRRSRRDGLFGDRAAGAPVRPGPWPEPDDFDQFVSAVPSSLCNLVWIRVSMWKSNRFRPPSMRATTFLPTDLPNPPIYSKVNPADSPIMTLALTSESLPLSKVEDLADTAMAQKISQLPGVGLVSISGGQKPAVRIQANPTALASYGLSLEDVRTALAAANVDQAKGTLERPAPVIHHWRE